METGRSSMIGIAKPSPFLNLHAKYPINDTHIKFRVLIGQAAEGQVLSAIR